MTTRTLRVPVVELLRTPGARRELTAEVVLDDVALPSVGVSSPGELSVTATIDAMTDGVAVRGVVTGAWQGPCRRCLEPVTGVLRGEFREIWEQGAAPAEELHPLVGDHVDLTAAVREAAVLALPLAPLCREDCAGPDPSRYPTLVESDDADDADGEPRDPRWAALDELRLAAGSADDDFGAPPGDG